MGVFALKVHGPQPHNPALPLTRPTAYGPACVALALFTGWFGGVLFKR